MVHDMDTIQLDDMERSQRKPGIPESSDKSVLRLCREFTVPGETIYKLVSNRWYAAEDANLMELSEDLLADESIQAAAVVNSSGHCIGTIRRSDLMSLYNRPFGRDVMRRETVQKIIRDETPLYHDISIIAASEKLKQFDPRGEVQHFPLKTGSGEYAGMISSQDLLVYLSDMMHNDISLARAVQKRLVREKTSIDTAQFELSASTTQAGSLGGDFYTVKNYLGKKWFLTLCDISGKGVSASLINSTMWGIIQAFDLRQGIAPLIHKLNDFFVTTFELERYATGIFIDLDAETGSLNIVDMGHGLAYILRNEKLLKIKSHEHNYPIGVQETIHPEIYRYSLQAGDILILATDGILKQENEAGQEYGLRRLKEFLIRHTSSRLADARAELLEDIDRFRGGVRLHDDLSLLMLRYR